MKKRETTAEFIKRIEALPMPDLTDKKTVTAFGNRMAEANRQHIREQDSLQKKSLGRAFTKVVR